MFCEVRVLGWTFAVFFFSAVRGVRIQDSLFLVSKGPE